MKTSNIRIGLMLLLAGSVVILALAVASSASSSQVESRFAADSETAVPEDAAQRLAGTLRLPTISSESGGSFDPEPFLELHAYLRTAFPRVHARLNRETVAQYSLLYTWRGSDPSLRPILLMGHLDVVPVEDATEWQENPFGGQIRDGFVWGRGAIDNKSAVAGILEAVELLLSEGFWPKRTILLAFGHDEEAGGVGGAQQIAALLRARRVEVELALDEGGVIGDGILPGISVPVALVGIAEKGFVSLELSTAAAGGHSSLPTKDSAIGILSDALVRLEASPMDARIEGATKQFLEALNPEYSFVKRAVLSNLWLTHPLVVRQLRTSPTTNAMIRTTAALTIFQSGTKDNVLPGKARAVVNFRVLPGDTAAGVLDHVRQVIPDKRVAIRVSSRFVAEPSAVSDTNSESYRALTDTIRQVTPKVRVAPYLVVVVTDSRYYADLSRNVFRFLLVRLEPGDVERMHGKDERIAVRNYEDAIRTYWLLIQNLTGDATGARPHPREIEIGL